MDVRTMQRRGKAGFTLAELLIVVAIMAVLTAVAVPVFSTQLEKARESADLQTMSNIYSEIALGLVDGTLVRNGDIIKVTGGGTTSGGSAYTAAAQLTRSGTGSTATMKVIVVNASLSQNINGWYQAEHVVSGCNVQPIEKVEENGSTAASAGTKLMTIQYDFTNYSGASTSTLMTTNFSLTGVKAIRQNAVKGVTGTFAYAA